MNPHQQTSTIQQSNRHTDTVTNLDVVFEQPFISETSTLHLVRRLCQMIGEAGITYCHWKSNNALDRSASGENDLDLLVSRADKTQFTEILCHLGFKPAKASAEKEMPGVLDYFGYDETADKLIHVHAHYQLMLGHDMTKNYRLPIEQPYLESAVQGDLFKVPAPEFEFVIFVIRMVLKHSTWDVILGREGKLKKAEKLELAYLQALISPDRVDDILKQYVPYVDSELFNNCIQALQPDCPLWTRLKIGQQLQNRLQADARRPLLVDIYLKLWRRVLLAVRRRVFKFSPKYRLEAGGAMIAIVGGDGAGKSTAVDAVHTWLSTHFETNKIHLGRPTWSWTTKSIRAILKTGNLLGLYPADSSLRDTLNQTSKVSPGYPWLLREVCRARDRYWTYIKARRFAGNGALVILDRFPLSQIELMDGPQAERFISELMAGSQTGQFMSPHQNSWLTTSLVEREKAYYQQIVQPELLFVLRVNPEIAVQRKTEEDPAFVRERSTEIWELDWEHSGAHVIDGSKSKTDVLAELKGRIWAAL